MFELKQTIPHPASNNSITKIVRMVIIFMIPKTAIGILMVIIVKIGIFIANRIYNKKLLGYICKQGAAIKS